MSELMKDANEIARTEGRAEGYVQGYAACNEALIELRALARALVFNPLRADVDNDVEVVLRWPGLRDDWAALYDRLEMEDTAERLNDGTL